MPIEIDESTLEMIDRALNHTESALALLNVMQENAADIRISAQKPNAVERVTNQFYALWDALDRISSELYAFNRACTDAAL